MDVNQLIAGLLGFLSDHSRLIAEYGAYFYLIAFVWTFLEGETVVLFAGFAAAQGLLDPLLLLIAAWLGSFAGDQCYFWLGRHFGVRLLDRFPRWRHGVDAALHWLERYDAGFILSFRFIYGVRNFSSFALGLSAVALAAVSPAELRSPPGCGRRALSRSAISSATRSAPCSATSPARSAWSCSASSSRSASACGSCTGGSGGASSGFRRAPTWCFRRR